FVVRAKRNLKFNQISWKRRLPKNILSDSTIEFVVYKSSKDYPIPLRRVVYFDEMQGRKFVFLTNNFDLPALTIAELYRNRWQVELFFKWLKQHLKIKKFWGTSENAVRVQIYCAIITYCLVVIIKHNMQIDRSAYEILQIIGISLTDKTHLRDLFDKSNFNNFKERSDSSEPNLFNF
ncbi:transposase, partial [Bacteroides sp.]|uniref:transposase n=1 Tax=Bacteroides sp. TaxID=29523 RepID=UPI002FC6893E